MVAKLRSFCHCIPFSTCRFPSFQLSLWSSHNSMRFICTFHMCKCSSGIPLIHFSVCEFFRLNPRFVSFLAPLQWPRIQIKEMKRSDLKYLNIAQNAYCSREIYLQFTKYPRPVILPSIIQMNARRRVSLVKINALFSRREYDLAH